MASKLRQLGELSEQGSALVAPMDSEAEAIREKLANRDAYNAPVVGAPAPVVAPVAYPPINPNAQYGDKAGEHRIDVNSMLTPLGSARAKGGPVEADEPYVVGEEGPEVIVPEENGEVIPNQGAPADFGGPVYANPDNVKPMLDTEQPELPKASVPMDISNPAPAQVIPGQPQEAQGPVKGKLSSTTLSGAPATANATGLPSPKPLGGHEAVAQQKAAQDVDVAKQRDVIEQDKKIAATKGPAGLVELGTAQVHEDVLNKTHPPEGVGLGQEQPVAPAPDASGLPTSSGTNPGLTEPTPNAEGLPTSGATDQGLGNANVAAPTSETEHADLEQRREALKATIAGPDTEAAGVATRQLAELNKNNPWGTAGNHPGLGGKILHGLAKAGNIAGNIVAPGTMELIPGTDLNMQQQRAQGIAEETQGAEINKADALAKAANAKGDAATKYEIKEVMDTRPGSPTQGKTVWAGVNPLDPSDVKYSPGEVAPKGKTGAEAPANAQQISEYSAQVPALTKNLTPEERTAYEFPTGYTPTLAEIATNKKDAAAADAAVLSGNRDARAQLTSDAAVKKVEQEERATESIANAIAWMRPNDLTTLRMLPARGNQRSLILTRAREINPEFNTAEVDRKIKMLDQYTNGTEGRNLQSFGTFFEHAGDLKDAAKALENFDYKLLSKPWNWLIDNIGRPEVARYLAAAAPVKKEFESFLLNNRALYTDDRKEIDEIIGPNTSPKAMDAAMNTMGHTIAARYNNMDNRFENQMGVSIREGIGDIPEQAYAAANKLGIDLGKTTGGGGGEKKAAPKTETKAPSEGQNLMNSHTFSDGSHPTHIANGPNGFLVWSGKPGDSWVDIKTLNETK